LLAMLRRGFLVVVPDNAPNVANCWIPPVDTPLVIGMINELRTTRCLGSLPLYGAGISNGGEVLNSMAFHGVPFAGLHLNVANPGQPRVGLPPTSFVVMQSDVYAAVDKIRKYAQETRDHSQTPVQVIEVVPKPLAELASRTQALGLSAEVSNKLIEQIKLWGWHKETAGVSYLPFFTSDQVLTRLSLDPLWHPIVAPFFKALYEELHVVEGVHGATSERFEQSLEWLLDPQRARTMLKAQSSTTPTDAAAAEGSAEVLTCDHHEALGGGAPTSRAQRSLALPDAELAALVEDPTTFSGLLSFLCTCLRLRVDAAPAVSGAATVTWINGTASPLVSPAPRGQSDAKAAAKAAALAALRSAKKEACRSPDLTASCNSCRQWDPFINAGGAQ